jgi:16S rRNA (guanine966-N2)-methyltransferase
MTAKVQLRIVAGEFGGRKIACAVNASLRPTPDKVREALFSILGNAVPDTPFFDVFAGSGIVGLEALSRGAGSVLFLERDLRQAKDIEQHLADLGCADRSRVLRTDVYRWAEHWQPPGEPVNVFLSPPFKDIQDHTENMLLLLQTLQERIPAGSLLILQSENNSPLDEHSLFVDWEKRKYGRNVLMLWTKK